MKTKLILSLGLSMVAIGHANAAAPDACCAVEVKSVVRSCCAELESDAPLSARSLYQLDARWTSDADLPLQLASLRGRPVVLAMFFSNCGYACPILVNDMERLQKELPEGVRAQAQFVLVSFDTARDTPEVLQAFRKRSSLDSAWTLVRGDSASVQELAMLLGVKFKQEANGQFAHSNLITILNPEGEIVHQRNGLMGDVSDAARAVAATIQ
jgi:protein SCO1/2